VLNTANNFSARCRQLTRKHALKNRGIHLHRKREPESKTENMVIPYHDYTDSVWLALLTFFNGLQNKKNGIIWVERYQK
jgi:hypothetical protein